MRSVCRRSIMTMSTSFEAACACRVKTSTPSRSTPAGIRVGGRDHAHPRAHDAAAGGCSSAPRGCAGCRRRSPPAGPRSRPRRRRMVSASSSAWVGCSWLPSPALMTAQSTFCDSRLTAPDSRMAHDQHVGLHGVQRHRRVEQRLALLDRARCATYMLMTSAPSRLPASSKEVRVRVEFSKNRLMRVRPARRSRFLSAPRLKAT